MSTADAIFNAAKTVGKGIATVYLGPAGAALVEEGANKAKKEITNATTKKKQSSGSKKKLPSEKIVSDASQNSDSKIRVSFDPVKKEIVMSSQDPDNTGARPRLYITPPVFRYNMQNASPASAVLPGKPTPLEYGATRTSTGGYVWPGGSFVRVNGRKIKKSVAMANYTNALRAWNARNAPYSQNVATRGIDAAARLAARAGASRMAALENRISELEAQVQESGGTTSEWSEDEAYYNQGENFEPGGYFDDDGYYGNFDGMSGADGDIGYARKYGRYPRPVGRRFASQFRPSTYYEQNVDIVDPSYGMYLDDYLMGPEDDLGDDDVNGPDDDVNGPDDDVNGPDDMNGVPVDMDGSDSQNLGDGDIGATRPALRPGQRGYVPPKQRPRTTIRQTNVPPAQRRNVPPAQRRNVSYAPRKPGPDHRDVIIAELKRQLMGDKLDKAVLASALQQGGHIIGKLTQHGENRLRVQRRVDGLSGEESTRQLPPPPPAPSNLGGSDDDYPSAVNLSGTSNDGPPKPPPAPTADELAGTDDCLPCGRVGINIEQ